LIRLKSSEAINSTFSQLMPFGSMQVFWVEFERLDGLECIVPALRL